MSQLKFLIPFLFTLLVIDQCKCQTLLGVESGVNWTSLRSPNDLDEGTINLKSFPSYYFSFEIKGRKSKHIHLGGDLSFFQSYLNVQATANGEFPDIWNVNLKYETLGIAIFPELSFGKTVQFFFNLSPYFAFIIKSAEQGTREEWNAEHFNYTTRNESGSAKDDFFTFSIGFQETFGIGYMVDPWLQLSIKETGFLGILPVCYLSGSYDTKDISLLFGVSFIIPKQQAKETVKPSN
ncbi:MAG: outer membrane beta-barrel protein [Bacteroidales bacterium]|jgi:hypothetical protein